jgi:hypothetical protein
MRKHKYPVAAAMLGLSFSQPAAALEYCVTCEGPPAMYRCVIDGTEEGPGNNPSVSLYCISQMAKQGGHESCAVSRGAPFPCPGLTAIIKQPGNLPTMAEPPPGGPPPRPEAAAPHPAEAASPAPQPPPENQAPDKVPQTVEELANQTVKSSKQGLEKAGEAIGGTAKKAGEQIGNAGSAIGNAASKTWTCITSLFSSCGSDTTKTPPDDPPPH